MGSPSLIWVLGLLTLATGALLVVMWRKRRAQQQEPSLPAEHSSRKLVDAYAIPVAFDKPPKRSEADDDEPGKICPVCGSRYAYHYRVCSRDDSELAALN